MTTLQTTFLKDRVVLCIGDLAPLSWFASGLESACLWFFGRGCFQVQITRNFRTDPIEVFAVITTTGPAPGPLQYSNFTTLAAMMGEKLFPERLVTPHETQNNETLINSMGLDLERTTLGCLAYGVSDATVDLFKRGALTVTAQYSRALSQIWADVGLNPAQVRQLANPSVADYQPGDHVGSLPWP